MKKILVLDLDGTLTNHKKEITPKTKAAIMEMQKQGHTVVLASGRPTRGVDPIRKELELDRYDGYTLAFNGARITRCSTNEVIYQQTLPEEIVPELFAMAKQEGIGMMTYDEQGIIANRHEDEFMDIEAMINQVQIRHFDDLTAHLTQPVNKCLGTAPVDIAPAIEKKFYDRFSDRINVSRSEAFFIELVPKGVDKAASLAKLCEILGRSRDDMIACGDGFNDISMIEFAGLGVAMENAQEPVKKVADYITRSNEEDGVAHVIHKYILAS